MYLPIDPQLEAIKESIRTAVMERDVFIAVVFFMLEAVLLAWLLPKLLDKRAEQREERRRLPTRRIAPKGSSIPYAISFGLPHRCTVRYSLPTVSRGRKTCSIRPSKSWANLMNTSTPRPNASSSCPAESLSLMFQRRARSSQIRTKRLRLRIRDD
jgi:hypothetical protein